MQNTSIEFFNQKQRNYKELRSILITGTKGKTSVSSMLNHLFDFVKQDTLYVSTSGVFQNKKKVYSYKDSIGQFGFAPTVMPGRYIYSLLKNGASLKDFTAILESSHSCGVFGTGMYEHKVGALLNIYTDHIDADTIYNRQGLYEMKSFVFRNLAKGGYYIANLDNDLSRKSLEEQILLDKKIHKIAFTGEPITQQRAQKIVRDFSLSDLFYINEDGITSFKKGFVYDLKKFRYLKFFPDSKPLKSNLLAFLAISSIYFECNLISESLESFRFPLQFGRMVLFKNKSTQQEVIIDYAHEPESLKLMVETLQSVYHKKPYLITRAASNHKTDININRLADAIVKFDLVGLTIYDLMSENNVQEMFFDTFERKTGEVAQIMNKQLQKNKPIFPYEIVLKETEALKKVINSGQELILHIHGNMEKIAVFMKENGFIRIL